MWAVRDDGQYHGAWHVLVYRTIPKSYARGASIDLTASNQCRSGDSAGRGRLLAGEQLAVGTRYHVALPRDSPAGNSPLNSSDYQASCLQPEIATA